MLRLLQAINGEGLTPARLTVIAFTVHEEGGGHGAKVFAHRERPEVFVAIDGCPMPPGSALKLDGRPGVWSKDARVHYDQRLVQALCAAAAGTQLQSVVYDTAFSDAGAVHDTGAAPRVGIVGHVRENSHGYEVARLSVFDHLLRALVEFIKRKDICPPPSKRVRYPPWQASVASPPRNLQIGGPAQVRLFGVGTVRHVDAEPPRGIGSDARPRRR